MTSVKIVSGGAGYTVAPNVRFSAGARVKGGNEAVAVAVVKDGAVVSVQLSTTQGYWLPIGAGNALFHHRTIVFPRQARDKHQETLKNQGFSAGDQWWNNAVETGVPTVTFEGGGGSGAEANVIVEESDPTFFQTIKQTLETRCEIGLFLSSSSS